MTPRQFVSVKPPRPVRGENAQQVKLDAARARVIAAGGPSLRDLWAKFADLPELSGQVRGK